MREVEQDTQDGEHAAVEAITDAVFVHRLPSHANLVEWQTVLTHLQTPAATTQSYVKC